MGGAPEQLSTRTRKRVEANKAKISEVEHVVEKKTRDAGGKMGKGRMHSLCRQHPSEVDQETPEGCDQRCSWR